ncbi:IS4 family transposase [Sulfobacillus acidophilus]|uniref:IS4 family transposase n=1 Tax=Sulfobacillus acidophilus TaxID=53633 RepID=A0ABS3AVY6_9FIRM|nr:IS4 family transposase [Sulfobacillus acidophilus]
MSVKKLVHSEAGTANFGDKRLNMRFKHLLGTFMNRPDGSILGSCNNWTESIAAYRFFSNEKVSPEKILAPHVHSTIERIKEQDIILLVQDTTEIEYNGRAPIEGLGPLSSPGEQGFHLHPTLAVTPQRLCLGILDGNVWVREKLGKKKERARKPIEEKESFRWLQSYLLSNEIAQKAPKTQVVNISDREGDIYEIFSEGKKETIENKAHFLVRAYQNRRLTDNTEDNNVLKLWDMKPIAKTYGEIEFKLPKTKKREARLVTQEIKACEVRLKPPDRTGTELPEVSINAVFCVEKDPPKGVEPLEWLLLTSLPIDTEQQISNIIKYYLCRWQIEIYFKVLKSGCKIEALQLKTYGRIERCLALYMIVAWRVMLVTMMGRKSPNLACDLLFTEEEWKSAYVAIKKKAPPENVPTLDEMIRIIASLGGFLNRKSDGYPGPKVIWKGLQRMHDITLGWTALQSITLKETYV